MIAAGTLLLTPSGLVPVESEPSIIWTSTGYQATTFKQVKKESSYLTTKQGKRIISGSQQIIGSLAVKNLRAKFPVPTMLAGGFKGIKFPLYSLNLSAGKNIHQPRSLNSDLAYMLGLQYGDGSVNKARSSIEVAMSDDWPEIKDKYSDIVMKQFGLEVLDWREKSGEQRYSRADVNSANLISYLRYNHCLKPKANVLSFPLEFLTWQPKYLGAFVSGYLDADGCVSTDVRFTSMALGFLQTLQVILLSQGIHSSMTSKMSKGNRAYDLRVFSQESLRRLGGFCCESVKLGLADQMRFKRKSHRLKVYGEELSFEKYLGLHGENPLVQDYVVAVKNLGKQWVYEASYSERASYFANGFAVN